MLSTGKMTNRLQNFLGRRFAYLLKFGFPKSVKIAVSINCTGLIFTNAESCFGYIAGLKSSVLTTVLSFNINLLNVMTPRHWMSYFTHMHSTLLGTPAS